VRVDGKGGGNFAVAEDFHRVLGLDESGLAQDVGGNGGFLQPGQTLEAYDAVFLAENVGEAAFGHTAMQRHLAAFKAAHQREPLRERWPLWAAGRGLSHAEPIPRPTRFFFPMILCV